MTFRSIWSSPVTRLQWTLLAIIALVVFPTRSMRAEEEIAETASEKAEEAADETPADKSKEKSEEKPAEKPAEKSPEGSAEPSEKTTEETPPLELHQWSVWLADPAADKINARDEYLTNLPLSVETNRPRRKKKIKTNFSPINVVTFYGKPHPSIEIDLRVKGGVFTAHWPAAVVKSNRLRWPEYKLLANAPEDAIWSSAPAEHWFSKIRQTDALVLGKASRTERFMTYDFEAALPLPVKLEGGPDTYNVRSTTHYPLRDLVIVVPTEKGKRIGWLDVLPAAHEKKPAGNAPAAKATPAAAPSAGQAPPQAAAAPVVVAPVPAAVPAGQPAAPTPAQPAAAPAPKQLTPGEPGPPVAVTLSEPVATDSEQWPLQSTGALRERLGRTGLHPHEVDLLMSLYGEKIFSSDSLLVAWRIESGTIEDVTPLVTDPETTKNVRVAIVIARNLDPKIEADLQSLVDRLASPDYQQREAAEDRLTELGSLAFPILKKTLTHSDPEVAFRAERMLSAQQQPIDIPKK